MTETKERTYTDWLVHAVKERSDVRSALRMGDIPQREAMAERYLLTRSGEWGIDARRLHAALIAQNPRIVDSKNSRDGLGDVLRRLTRGPSGMARDTVEEKIVLLQRQRLRAAHQTIRSLLRAASANGRIVHLNVESLLWIYLQWDKDGPRYPQRREILRHYYRSEATDESKNDTKPSPIETAESHV